MYRSSRLSRLLTHAGGALFLVAVFLPVLALVWNTKLPEDTLQLILPAGRRLRLLLDSLSLALFTSALSLFLGALVGPYLLQHGCKLPVRVKLLFPAMLLIPSHIHSLAWSKTFHLLAIVLPFPMLTGLPAAVWVQTMYFLPLSAGFATLGLAGLDKQQVEAGLTTVTPQRVWLSIVIPQISPSLFAGAGLIFVFSLVDYSIPSLFQVSTYAIEIFAESSASNLPIRPLLLALPLLTISAFVLITSHQSIQSILLAPAWDRGNSFVPPWPKQWLSLRAIGIIVMLTQIFIPLVVLVSTVNDLSNLLTSIADSSGELLYSLKISLTAAALSLGPALAFAQIMTRGRTVWWLVCLLPLALPAPLVGSGLVALFNTTPLAGRDLLPILASTVRFMPVGALVLATAIIRLSSPQLEAGQVFARLEYRFFLRIILPLLWPGVATAGLLIFAFSLGELGATLMVVPPGSGTLTMKIYNYLHAGAYDAVSGMCLAILGLVLLAATLVQLIRTKYQN